MSKKLFLIALLISTLSSCTTQRMIVNQNPQARERGYSYTSQFQMFFIYGIGQTQTTNLGEICGSVDNIHSALVKDTFINIVLRGLTWGIYTPRAVRVYCIKSTNNNY